MNTPQQLAKHFRDVFSGGNWTTVNLKDALSGLNYTQATTKIHDLNTIAVLTYHIGYYVTTIRKVLLGGPLEGNDKMSFELPPITSEDDWQQLQQRVWKEVDEMTELIGKLEEDKIYEDFTNPKYGTYYRNLLGVTEHTHYHLGQIVILKKLILAQPL